MKLKVLLNYLLTSLASGIPSPSPHNRTPQAPKMEVLSCVKCDAYDLMASWVPPYLVA
jgi:hypothetical protein